MERRIKSLYDWLNKKYRNLYFDGCSEEANALSMVISEIEKQFPELKESEDEKIRKWIVRTLKSLNNSSIQIDGAYEMMLPAIAWLEKQNVRRQWKPSEEYLQTLERSINWLSEYGINDDDLILNGLLEELKQL